VDQNAAEGVAGEWVEGWSRARRSASLSIARVHLADETHNELRVIPVDPEDLVNLAPRSPAPVAKSQLVLGEILGIALNTVQRIAEPAAVRGTEGFEDSP
jgi:hypothetical protein